MVTESRYDQIGDQSGNQTQANIAMERGSPEQLWQDLYTRYVKDLPNGGQQFVQQFTQQFPLLVQGKVGELCLGAPAAHTGMIAIHTHGVTTAKGGT